MYCPKCGSNNLDEIKFCTRCGTNLNVVSEALIGKSATGPQFDERMVEALKDYYASRRAMVIGGLLILIPSIPAASPMAQPDSLKGRLLNHRRSCGPSK